MAVDFFELQELARKRTKRLVGLFFLAVASIIFSFYVVFLLFSDGPLWQPELLGTIAIVVLLVVFLGSAYKSSQLALGGSSVAQMLGGVEVPPDTNDLSLRRLLNVVEEMAIASGCPVPTVYLLPNEKSINAFAAGLSPNDAVIGVTLGAVENLNRDELQGVIAHEFSHILNGDMRLNLLLISYIFGILCIAMIGRALMQAGVRSSIHSRQKDREGVALAFLFLGLAAFVIGLIGVFFARIIQAAISRQREYLADASAVQFTRNPYGIASALHRISQLSSRILNAHSEETSHLFFGNPLPNFWVGIFATHPPIKNRIRAIAPDFWEIRNEQNQSPKKFSLSEIEKITANAQPSNPPTLPDEANWLATTGQLSPLQIANAPILISSLSPEILAIIRKTDESVYLIYSLLFSKDPETQSAQMKLLNPTDEEISLLKKFQALVATLDFQQRITAVELAIPSLRKLLPNQRKTFLEKVHQLVLADKKIEILEFFIQKLLHLRISKPPQTSEHSSNNILAYLPDIAIVLGALAIYSTHDSSERKNSYQAGIRELLVHPNQPVLEQPQTVTWQELDAALDHLSQSPIPIRRRVLTACGAVVLADNSLYENEAQFLRVIASILECPVPPFINLSAHSKQENQMIA